MAEELKGLIEKIQREGVKAAEDKAHAIEVESRKRAEEIVSNAKKEAERIILAAKSEIKRLEDGAKGSIKQAARDTMLILRKEITSCLERIAASHVHKALSSEDLTRMLAAIIKCAHGDDKGKISVVLKKEDIEKVEKALLSELGQEVKKGVTLKSADLHGGFMISYDEGKSYFDFSDKALADYIASRLKPSLGEILKG